MIVALYADDEVETGGMLSRFDTLLEEGIRVIPVGKARDIIGEIGRSRGALDVVILDVIMPAVGISNEGLANGGIATGVAVARDISTAHPDLPIVIVSVRPQAELEKLLAGVKIAAFVRKPVDGTRLARCIKAVLPNRGAA